MNIILLGEVSAAAVIGGAERVLREQALGLRRKGHHVGAVVRAPAGDSRAQVTLGHVVERRYTVSRRNEAVFLLSSAVNALKAFDQARGSEAVDTVIIHQALAGLGPILWRKHRVRSWTYMCLSLAHEEFLTRQHPGNTLAARMRYAMNARVRLWTERIVMRRCDRVMVLSEFMWRRVQAVHGIPETRLRLVPGAADLTRFYPPKDALEVRRELKLPENKVILFTVRNLVPRMGLDNLLEAIAALGEEGRDTLLLIGGDGPLHPTLRGMIRDLNLSDRVRLLGFIPEETLPRYYQAADLVIMPTQQLEGFGLVTVEALACGTPVLGTPVAAIPEVLACVDPVLVAEGTDGRSLARAIRRVLGRFRDCPGEEQRLSARGRDLVQRRYTWDNHNEQLTRVLQEICSQAAA